MKFYVRKLGCPKNDVDADYISGRLIADGLEPVDRPDMATVIVVNTCGFILAAKEESINEMLRLCRLKASGEVRRVYAAGCLAQRYGEELRREMPELDGVFGLGQLQALSAAVQSTADQRPLTLTPAARLLYIAGEKRAVTDGFPYAYLKISDGCDRTCSFCAIPAIRGSYRSRSLPELMAEARFLAAQGKKELILVSQEATLYGHDLKKGYDLLTLLQELETVEGVAWIRLLYLYPTQVSAKLIEYMARGDNKTLCYFDLPLQHVSDHILEGMQRHTTRRQIEEVIGQIRAASERSVIRTSLMVGFPGESAQEFSELKDFVAEVRFERLGAFTYSCEEGTAAAVLGDPVSEAEKLARMDELMTLQADLAAAGNNSLIGEEVLVIIDSVEDTGRAVGRTEADCPEIDQEVLVRGNNLTVGDICRVRVNSVQGYDLVGTKTGD